MRIDANGYKLSFKRSARIRGEAIMANLSNFLPVSENRRFHAYCVGTPRSGTHSLAYMFLAKYSSDHEPAPHDTIIHIIRWLKGEYSKQKMKNLLLSRDRYLHLEMEASHYLNHIIELLVHLFPASKFILTVRDPISWLNSEINQNSITERAEWWSALERYRYGRYNHRFTDKEKILKKINNAYPIDSYLKYWNDHNQSVICSVPEERIMVLNTKEISNRVSELACFLSIDPGSIDLSLSHSGVKVKTVDIREEIDPDFLYEKVQEHCGNSLFKINKLRSQQAF